MPASDPRLVAIEWARLEGQRPRPAGSNARLGEYGSRVSVPLPFEFPLWELAGQLTRQPVYALAAKRFGLPLPEPLRVPCYDTSLYFDDLALASHADTAALLADEAREGYARGHRAFAAARR